MRYLIFFFAFLASFLYADIYDDFYSFKVELYNRKDKSELASSIEEWEKAHFRKNLSEEEVLTCQNLLALEKISLLQESANKKRIYKILKERDALSSKFLEKHKAHSCGKWFLLSYGDIKSRLTAYASFLNVYSESKMAMQCYQDAIKKDKNFSPAYIAQGLWQFFAPAIAGGSYENALKSFNASVSSAKNNDEKYLALVFRSQAHFKMKHTKEWQEDLQIASSLIADEKFTKYVRSINSEKNKVFFE